MDQHPVTKAAQTAEPIVLSQPSGGYRTFAIFLICASLLVAAIAFSGIWLQTGNGKAWLERLGSFGPGGKPEAETETESGTVEKKPSEKGTDPAEGSQETIPVPLPEGAVPVISMDLSAPAFGTDYIHNETPYTPDIRALSQTDFALPAGSINAGKPLVLILHTHTTESYLPEGSGYIAGDIGAATYSSNCLQNVLAVGKTLCRVLNEKGIPAIHCTAVHDEPSMRDSYRRAADSIRYYRELYPSIQFVIDLHRDAVMTANGAYIRTVAERKTEAGENTASTNGTHTGAQILAVVGTDCNGNEHPEWERNLALALCLRDALNAGETRVCRPPSLRNSSYNQELAPYSLLLEIGSGGNSLGEAEAAATLVGEALAGLLQAP